MKNYSRDNGIAEVVTTPFGGSSGEYEWRNPVRVMCREDHKIVGTPVVLVSRGLKKVMCGYVV